MGPWWINNHRPVLYAFIFLKRSLEMDVKISEIIALIGVILYSIATILPDIFGAITGSKKADKK